MKNFTESKLCELVDHNSGMQDIECSYYSEQYVLLRLPIEKELFVYLYTHPDENRRYPYLHGRLYHSFGCSALELRLQVLVLVR